MGVAILLDQGCLCELTENRCELMPFICIRFSFKWLNFCIFAVNLNLLKNYVIAKHRESGGAQTSDGGR